MLDRKWAIDHWDEVQALLKRRGTAAADLPDLPALDAERRGLIQEIEALRHERKERSATIGQQKKAGEDTTAAQAAVRELGEGIAGREAALGELEATIADTLLGIPNLPLDDVPAGTSDADNVEVRSWGEIPATADWHRPHWEVGEARGILDLERAARTSGARFAFLRGLGARLELSLARFMMDRHSEHGYEEILPPYLVRGEALQGTGQLPKFGDDLFRVAEHDLYLIPTAEVPVTNLYAGEILEAEQVPQRFVAFSPCFRAEAGAAGQDTRGIIRVHQFHKVELVRLERPDASHDALEDLSAHAEAILQALGLTYRVVALCAGDLGFSAAKTYDLEVWLPGQQRWLEISSCSTFGDYQARRMNLRFRPAPGAKPEYLHTLNGSGLAVGRTVVAILEQYQQPDGTVRVPEALREWMKADTI